MSKNPRSKAQAANAKSANTASAKSKNATRQSRRAKQKKKSILPWLSLAGLGLIIGSVVLGTLWWRSQINPVLAQGNADNSGVEISVPPGTSANEVGQILQEKNLIHSLTAWKIWTRWAGLTNKPGGFQAGTYEISATASLPTIAEKIWTGQVKEDAFTIPEGWTLKQMANLFEQEEWFSAQAFLDAVDLALVNRPPWLPQSIDSLEGFLFPDTYQIPVDSRTPEKVVESMLKRFEQIALPIYEASANPQGMNLQKWVTLASIIEKEAVVDEERALIAGVFANRLERGIPLGSDPTVEYGLGFTQTEDQPLTFAQVKTPSPYNTYLNAGLTPTPIAAPGIASLKVALDPAKTDYLYFVARYDGTHVFTKTLADHQRAQDQIWDERDAKSSS